MLTKLLFDTAIGNRLLTLLEKRWNLAIVRDEAGRWQVIGSETLGSLTYWIKSK